MRVEPDKSQPSELTYADLFAGCGGLSLGLEWAGFHRAAAMEISPDAALTYYHNLICREELAPFQWSTFLNSDELQLSTGLVVGDVTQKLGAFITSCKKRSPHLDLLAGGPPCQGFSVAGRRDPEDPRNKLVDYFAEATRLLQPSVVLVENVPAINMPFNGMEPSGVALGPLLKKLHAYQYVTSIFHLKSDTVGVPQRRIRLFVLGIRGQLFELLPEHVRLSWQVKDGLARSIKTADNTPTVAQALGDIGPEGYKFGPGLEYEEFYYAKSLRFGREFAVPTASSFGEELGYTELHNHELRNHKPNTIARFEFYLYLRRLGLFEQLLHRASVQESRQIAEQIRSRLAQNGLASSELDKLTRELTEKVLRFKTRKHTQIVLDANLPARTITTLPDDLIHYAAPRVLSVRELARLQSFPDSFIFKGKPTTGGLRRRVEAPQYSQVGNAVPPLMARAVGQLIRGILEHVQPTAI